MAILLPNEKFTQLASEKQVTKTVQALEAHGIRTVVVETGEEARTRVLDMIPSGVEVYNSVSRTLEFIGLAADIEHATRFQPIRARLRSLDLATQQREMRKLTASPDVLVGSVHAITEQGEVLLASAVGSQLAPAVAGAGSVIWVVGTQKLVRSLEDGLRRIQEYSYPSGGRRLRHRDGGQCRAFDHGSHGRGRYTACRQCFRRQQCGGSCSRAVRHSRAGPGCPGRV